MSSVPKPPFWGSRVVKDIPVEELYSYLDEPALFKSRWQFSPAATSQEYEDLFVKKVRPILESLKKKYRNVFSSAAVYGYFPCQAEGNDLSVFDEARQKETAHFRFPRQKAEPNLCVADYFRAKNSGEFDVAAFTLVTVGCGASQCEQELFKKKEYTDYFYLHGLSVELAEALAEYVHARIRRELGLAPNQGCRFSPGYPAFPDLADQKQFFKLLEPERIGVRLTETFQLVPEQSTSALIVHNPKARTFNV